MEGIQTWRVVRADRSAVLVVPADGADAVTKDVATTDAFNTDAATAGAAATGGDEPRRVPLPRDGLAPADRDDAGRVVPTVGDLVLLDDTGIASVLPRRSALVRDSAGRTSWCSPRTSTWCSSSSTSTRNPTSAASSGC